VIATRLPSSSLRIDAVPVRRPLSSLVLAPATAQLVGCHGLLRRVPDDCRDQLAHFRFHGLDRRRLPGRGPWLGDCSLLGCGFTRSCSCPLVPPEEWSSISNMRSATSSTSPSSVGRISSRMIRRALRFCSSIDSRRRLEGFRIPDGHGATSSMRFPRWEGAVLAPQLPRWPHPWDRTTPRSG
jgi:hypothetical protein